MQVSGRDQSSARSLIRIALRRMPASCPGQHGSPRTLAEFLNLETLQGPRGAARSLQSSSASRHRMKTEGDRAFNSRRVLRVGHLSGLDCKRLVDCSKVLQLKAVDSDAMNVKNKEHQESGFNLRN